MITNNTRKKEESKKERKKSKEKIWKSIKTLSCLCIEKSNIYSSVMASSSECVVRKHNYKTSSMVTLNIYKSLMV